VTGEKNYETYTDEDGVVRTRVFKPKSEEVVGV